VTQLLVLEVKAQAGQAAASVTELAMRACGGAAFGSGLPVGRLFRDARASEVMAPTTDVAQEFIGRALVGMELF
jgi:alkylation response protein AidB-like acyl-CoA dehydrogenase